MIVFVCVCFCILVMYDMKEIKEEGEEEIFLVMFKFRIIGIFFFF